MSEHDPKKKLPNEAGYDRWSLTYDTTLNSTVLVDDAGFPPLWSGLRDGRVLEIGCGTGRHTGRLLDQGNEVVALDLSAGMLSLARERHAGRAVHFVQGDVLTMPAATLTGGRLFDGALSALVLEHIADLDSFFAKIASLLAVNARLFVSEIHPLRAKAGRLAHFSDPTSGDEIWLDSRAHDEGAVEDAAAQAGFILLRAVDLPGTEDLVARNPGWIKYLEKPMVKAWAFRKGT